MVWPGTFRSRDSLGVRRLRRVHREKSREYVLERYFSRMFVPVFDRCQLLGFVPRASKSGLVSRLSARMRRMQAAAAGGTKHRKISSYACRLSIGVQI